MVSAINMCVEVDHAAIGGRTFGTKASMSLVLVPHMGCVIIARQPQFADFALADIVLGGIERHD